MRLRLTSGSVTPFKPRQESLRRVHADHAQAHALFEQVDGFAELVLAQQAGIHEHIDQAVADGAMHQRRGHRGIHAAAQRADGPLVAHLPANGFHRFGDEGRAAPIGPRAANRENEIAQDFRAALGVLHFGMELHREDAPRGILGRGKRLARRAGDVKARRQRAARGRHGSSRSSAAAAVPRKAPSRRANRFPRGPYSRRSARSTLPPSVCAIHCRP